jgi:hypothetical protein
MYALSVNDNATIIASIPASNGIIHVIGQIYYLKIDVLITKNGGLYPPFCFTSGTYKPF